MKISEHETAIAEDLLDRLNSMVDFWNSRTEEELAVLPKDLRWFVGRVARRYNRGRLIPATKGRKGFRRLLG